MPVGAGLWVPVPLVGPVILVVVVPLVWVVLEVGQCLVAPVGAAVGSVVGAFVAQLGQSQEEEPEGPEVEVVSQIPVLVAYGVVAD